MEEAGTSSAQQDLPHFPQFEYTEEEQESIMADQDIFVRDPILPVFYLYKVIDAMRKTGKEGLDPLNVYKS